MRHIRALELRVRALRRRVQRNRRKLDVTTQAVREGLIVDLEEAFEFAKKQLKWRNT